MLRLSLLGLLIAVTFGAYFETDPSLESPRAVWAATVSVVLCPGSLLFVTFIDAEPRTSGFLFMWLAIGLINIALYGAIGAVIGRFLWKSA
jgi:drug/metabolite transporter (DMT)-like permease